MTDPEKLTALKKVYAETILNTVQEAAARVMISEKKARGYQQELVEVREEAVRTCLRLKQMYDLKVKEAEMISLVKQQKIDELEAQLGEAEDIVGDLRMDLQESYDQLKKLTNVRRTHLSNEGITPNETVSLVAREDSSSNQQRSVVANVIKQHLSDGINRCVYKENKDPCHYTLPSILCRQRKSKAKEINIANGDCAEVEARKEEEKKEKDMEITTASVSPSENRCYKYTFERKRKKDVNRSSPEGGGSSSQDDDSRNKRQKTSEKDNGYRSSRDDVP